MPLLVTVAHALVTMYQCLKCEKYDNMLVKTRYYLVLILCETCDLSLYSYLNVKFLYFSYASVTTVIWTRNINACSPQVHNLCNPLSTSLLLARPNGTCLKTRHRRTIISSKYGLQFLTKLFLFLVFSKPGACFKYNLSRLFL